MINHSKLLMLILCAALAFIGASCKKDSVVLPEDGNGSDTTSHNFAWTTFALGDGDASGLRDVAIINDTLAFAVGEVYLKDSTGQFDPEPYGLARWDGKNWSLEKVSYHDYGTTSVRPGTLNTICAFGPDDVYVCSSASLLHWNGTRWTERAYFMVDAQFNGQVNKMWGSSGTSIYCVGRNGAIYHYIGSGWQKIESGTSLSLYDICGSYSGGTNEVEVLAVGSNVGSADGRIILEITNQSSSKISSNGIIENTTAIWFEQNRSYYLSSGGVLFHKGRLTDSSWTTLHGITPYAVTSICGNGTNDVFACAAYGDIVHFNGKSWESFYEQTQLSQGVYGTIKSKNNIAIAVGFLGSRAMIAVGKRHT